MAIDVNTLASIGTIALSAVGLAGLVFQQGRELRAELKEVRADLKEVRAGGKGDHQAAMEALEKVNDTVLQTRTELGARLTSLEERTYDIATRLTPPPRAQQA